MTASTANRAMPYPLETDYLGDTAAHVQALAEALEAEVTDWTALALGGGFAAYGPAFTPSYSAWGDLVTLRGRVDGPVAAGSLVTTLPAGFRPTQTGTQVVPAMGLTSGGAWVAVPVELASDGSVTWAAAHTADALVCLDGITFSRR